jgi:co-chaperonin GroES (HSP10)
MTTAVGRNIANIEGVNWLKENLVHKVDPRQAILDAIGNLEGEAPDLVQFSRILVAVYVRPRIEKTLKGILLPGERADQEQKEDIYQGKVGLIIAMGKQAYQDDETTKFHGVKNNVGDWVWFRPSDGMGCYIGDLFCRLLTENAIIGRIPDPDYVW